MNKYFFEVFKGRFEWTVRLSVIDVKIKVTMRLDTII